LLSRILAEGNPRVKLSSCLFLPQYKQKENSYYLCNIAGNQGIDRELKTMTMTGCIWLVLISILCAPCLDNGLGDFVVSLKSHSQEQFVSVGNLRTVTKRPLSYHRVRSEIASLLHRLNLLAVVSWANWIILWAEHEWWRHATYSS